MNSDLFRTMQGRLSPSEGAQAALREKLAAPSPVRRPAPWKQYAAVAACAVLAAAAFPIYSAVSSHSENVRLHSCTLAEYGVQTSTAESAVVETDPAPSPDGGEVNWTTPDSGDSSTTGSGETAFVSQSEAIGLYNALLDYLCETYGQQEDSFDPNWPGWYGGGYLNNHRPDRVARLTLVLVEELDTPELRQEIIDALGSENVDFVPGKYSLSSLRQLQDSLLDYSLIKEVFAGSGVDEEENRVNLWLTEVDDQVLALLSRLDPEDDAIHVTAGQRDSVDAVVEYPAGAVSHAVDPDTPVGPGNYADGTVLAEEPDILRPGDDGYLEPSPEPTEPAVEFPPQEGAEPAFTLAYDPAVGYIFPSGAREVEEGASPNFSPSEAKFAAVVLEVNGAAVLAECTGGIREGDQVTFSWEDTALSPGDRIAVVFGGEVLETWPLQLGGVVSVTPLPE